jgi:hypothetical protein
MSGNEIPTGYERRLDQPKIAAKLLEFLVELLYPHADEENPEIIRLRDIERRYPLTRLQPNGPARQALAQSRRINRSQRQLRQLGLCEFYTGLIFLYYNGDSHRAVTQFTEARIQWGLMNEALSVSLSHYGQGLAHYHDGDYEAALRQFTTVERQLQRIHLSHDQERFLFLLRHYLDEDKTALLRALWPDEIEPKSTPAQTQTPALVSPPQVSPPQDSPVPLPEAETAAPPYLSDADTRARAADGRQRAPAARPLDQMNAPTPIPGHFVRGQRYAWYEVVERSGHFLKDVRQGAVLLVDKKPELAARRPGTPVIVGSEQEQIGGCVQVKPFGEGSEIVPRVRIHYLGRMLGRDVRIDSARFHRDTSSGNVTLQMDSNQRIEIQEDRIVGVVVGMWQQQLFSR